VYSANSTLTVQVRDYPSRLLVRFKSEDEATFLAFKDSFRRRFAARWSRADRAWFVPTSERGALRDWLTLHVGLDVVWVDELDSRARASGYAPPSATDPASQAAYVTLCLTPDAPLPLVELVYRWYMKTGGHPDTGGHHAQAVALNQAVALIRAAS
jgi:hypothetical protein